MKIDMLSTTQFYHGIVFYEKKKKASNGQRNKARRMLKKCDIIVVKKNGNSRPCYHCLKFLKQIGVRRVYYTVQKTLKMEKVKEMESDHISCKYRMPWSMWN